MTEIPIWCELKEVHKVVLDKSVFGGFISSSWEAEDLVTRLNNFFQEHTNWDSLKCKVETTKVMYCKMCDNEYIPEIDYRGYEICSFCRKGKVDFAVQVLDDKGGKYESILSQLQM